MHSSRTYSRTKGRWNISNTGPRFGSTKLAAAIARGALTLAVLSALLLVGARPAPAQTEKVLYSFLSYSGDGAYPKAGLVFDTKGNLYGTTYYGGVYGYGTVFEITSAGTEKVLHSFGSQSGDGYSPWPTLVFGKKGNLYGTTDGGGAYDYGTVFEIATTGKKAGTEKVLYSFNPNGTDGYSPVGGLVFDKEGDLYGTTYAGGEHNEGTVFEITAAGKEEVLYSFGNQSPDGYSPAAGLVFDKEGNLYGTTYFGGDLSCNLGRGCGTVFEITSAGTEKVLYSFGSQSGDGVSPWAGLIFDKKGNLYGTTTSGGSNGTACGSIGCGTVFELTAAGTEKVLYSFGSQSGDGIGPWAGLIFDKKGNLYGTTEDGGAYGDGTVFEIATTGKKAGTEKVLYSFGSQSGDGNGPMAGLIFDKEGNLYGTTDYGGAYEVGTVFEVTP
jgi:uncharacterized repeat protein (TIGR03803 family)